jgi:hypothetical protein
MYGKYHVWFTFVKSWHCKYIYRANLAHQDDPARERERGGTKHKRAIGPLTASAGMQSFTGISRFFSMVGISITFSLFLFRQISTFLKFKA